MGRFLQLVFAMPWLCLPLMLEGCAGETFASAGGNGGSTQTSTQGGGGAIVTTATGGAGGTGGGVGGAPNTTTSAGGQGGQGGTPICAPLSDMCATCAYNTCEELYCICYMETDCAQLVNCVNNCPPADAECQQPCLEDHKDSISKAFLLGGCVAKPCADECPGVTPLGDCETCLFTNCGPKMNECLANADCLQLLQCVLKGGDAIGCAEMFPEGFNAALSVQTCKDSECGNGLCP